MQDEQVQAVDDGPAVGNGGSMQPGQAGLAGGLPDEHQGVWATRRMVAAPTARARAGGWQAGGSAVGLNLAAPNAARTSATLGKVSRTAAVPGQADMLAAVGERRADQDGSAGT